MKTDIGKCRPLYDAAQGVADGVCDLGLDSFVSTCIAAIFYALILLDFATVNVLKFNDYQ